MTSALLTKDDRRLLRGVTALLVAAFSLILFLVVAGFLTEQRRVIESDNFSKLSNASAEVGAISQKTALLLFGALGQPDEALLKKLHDGVAAELQRFDIARGILSNDSYGSGLNENAKNALQSLAQKSFDFENVANGLQQAIVNGSGKRDVASQFAEQAVKLLEAGRVTSQIVTDDAASQTLLAESTVRRYYFLSGLAVISTGFAVLLGLLVRLRRELKMRRFVEQNLLQSNQELERFSSVVAHDLKAPLNTIAITAKLMADETLNSRELMSTISSETERLREMVQSLLHLSHVQSAELELQPMQLSSVVTDVRESLQAHIDRSHATVKLQQDATVWGDRILLHNVFQNLIENSLKYSGGRAPQISISGTEKDEEVIIVYEDNGIGIDSTMRTRVFDPFVQTPLQKDQGGVGLGLSVVRKIVVCHGGTIEIVDKKGPGTRFVIQIPHHPLTLGNTSEETSVN